jgi:hypothetical protein
MKGNAAFVRLREAFEIGCIHSMEEMFARWWLDIVPKPSYMTHSRKIRLLVLLTLATLAAIFIAPPIPSRSPSTISPMITRYGESLTSGTSQATYLS